MVTKFNSDASYSKKLLESIMKQKLKLEDEARKFDEKISSYQSEIKRK